MKAKLINLLYTLAVFLLGVIFVVKSAGPAILKLYLESGVGNCRSIPILCMGPGQDINNPPLNREYLAELVPYRFKKIEVLLPRGFNVIQETVKKLRYKKHKRMDKGAAIYLLYKEPDFFLGLFPNLKKQGITDNYKFLERMIAARLDKVSGVSDAFFIIMKGIFTPDLSDQKRVETAHFTLEDKQGFINYNLNSSGNYFDCNIVSGDGSFFKIYIRDKEARLNLDKVFTIISTLSHP